MTDQVSRVEDADETEAEGDVGGGAGRGREADRDDDGRESEAQMSGRGYVVWLKLKQEQKGHDGAAHAGDVMRSKEEGAVEGGDAVGVPPLDLRGEMDGTGEEEGNSGEDVGTHDKAETKGEGGVTREVKAEIEQGSER